MNNTFPKKYRDLIGTTVTIQGGVFGCKAIPATEFEVLDIRWGSGFFISNVKQFVKNPKSAKRHPTFELLVKNGSMPRSRWTRGFPMKERTLKD